MSKAKTKPMEFHYDIIRSPVITEKATALSEFNKVVFRVSPNATKAQVKEAVQALFDVKVEKVNTIVLPGKVKRFRGIIGKQQEIKKAIVTLAKGQSIDMAAGVK